MNEIIKAIAFISWPVTDMERAVIYYKNLFDRNPLFQQSDWAEFEIQGQRLALHLEPAISNSPNNATRPVLFFMATSIESSIKNLQEKGICFDQPVQIFPYGKLIRFSDPDGNPLGLYEPPSKTDTPNAVLK